MAFINFQKALFGFSCLAKNAIKKNFCTKSQISSCTPNQCVEFGFVFDVDGVFTRGPSALPAALRASELLHDRNGMWRVPVLFLTNAANTLKKNKAMEISNILHKKISSSEISTPHSVLRFFSLFDKHVFVCGHGPLKDVARNIGFKQFSTTNDILAVFPWLDACKPKNELYTGNIQRMNFKKIEAIIIFGEPEQWQQSLQIIIDLLIQNGDLNKTPQEYLSEPPPPQLPIFACSSDLVWTTNAPSPRIALGSFLSCLEVLYEQLTDRPLTYTSLLGKPNPLAYIFALSQINAIAAKQFGAAQPLKRIYCFGDNAEVDIYGANLFDTFLRTVSDEAWRGIYGQVTDLVQQEHPCLFPPLSTAERMQSKVPKEKKNDLIRRFQSMPNYLRELAMRKSNDSSFCAVESVLVMSGVCQALLNVTRSGQDGASDRWGSHHVHHYFPDLAHLYKPRFVAADVAEAVSTILSLEGVSTGVESRL